MTVRVWGIFFSLCLLSAQLASAQVRQITTLETQAQIQTDGVSRGRRYLTKLVKRPSKSGGTTNTVPVQTFTSDLGWIRYPSPSSPIPLIKNEELILLKAEAEIGLSDFVNAVLDINVVRQTSGGLAPDTGTVDQPSLLAELLYTSATP